MKLNNKQSIIIFLSCLLVALGLLVFFQIKPQATLAPLTEIKNSTESVEVEIEKTISSTIVAGSTRLQVDFTPGLSLYEVLINEQKKNTLVLVGEDYPNLGFFVTQIGDLRNGDNDQYLMYYINGQEASAGISDYILQDKDLIEWKLK